MRERSQAPDGEELRKALERKGAESLLNKRLTSERL